MMASSDWIDFALGLPLSDPPGTRFAYCSPGFHLLSAAIAKATGAPASDLAARLLFEPLGIVLGDWPIGPSGHNHGWGDLRLHPLDLAKIGFLFLHDGRWDKTRILPEGWVKKATHSRGPTGLGADGYGLGWWVPSGDLEGAIEARGPRRAENCCHPQSRCGGGHDGRRLRTGGDRALPDRSDQG